MLKSNIFLPVSASLLSLLSAPLSEVASSAEITVIAAVAVGFFLESDGSVGFMAVAAAGRKPHKPLRKIGNIERQIQQFAHLG